MNNEENYAAFRSGETVGSSAENTPQDSKKGLFGVNDLTIRAIILAGLGSALITASSMYVALRLSALPWPTVFVAVLSMSILKALGKTNLREINMASTGMSAGAMVAGGLAFTIPGLFITGEWSTDASLVSHIPKLLFITFAGVILGLLLTYITRHRFVIRDRLPFPIGQAAARTLEAGDAGGLRSMYLYGAMTLSAIFTFLRDRLAVIPAAMTSASLYAKNIYMGIWLSPMAVGIGYTIGPLFTGIWFAGSIFAYGLLIPLGVSTGIFADAAAAVSVKNSVGLGLMVGVGVGVLIDFMRSRIDHVKSEGGTKGVGGRLLGMLAVVIAYIFTLLADLNPIVAAAVIALTFLASAMSGTITGQTGINPMEIFGIMTLLAVRVFANPGLVESFFITAVVAVACGFAGDMLNDYKAGSELGTDPAGQLVTQAVGGLTGGFTAVFAMIAIISQYGGVGAEYGLSAGQAFAVTQMVGGIENPVIFFSALALSAVLYLMKFPVMTLGLGIYLSFEISSIVFVGGFIRFIVDKVRKTPVDEGETGGLIAAGLLGGEGVTGVALAIIGMFTGG